MTALLLTVSMLAGLLGCASDGAKPSATETREIALEENAGDLTIATKPLAQNLNAFFADSAEDRQLLQMTNVNLIGKTRGGNYVLQGIEGQTETYNRTEYTYDGIADIGVKKAKTGTVTYTIRLREGVVFSDGEPLTADDLLFTLYVMLDPTYDGPYEVNTLPIKGLPAYTKGVKKRYRVILSRGEDNEEFDLYTKRQQKKFFAEYWPNAKKKFIRQILDHYEAKSIAAGMIAAGYANKNEDTGVVSTITTYKHFTMKDKDKPTWKDFWEEIFKNTLFGNDVDVMSDYFVSSGIVEKGISELLPEKYTEYVETSKKPKDAVSGIRKKGEDCVIITLTEADGTALEKLSIPVLPLHYYGDREAFDVKAHSFGLQKCVLDPIRAKNREPIGAGPFVYAGYRDEIAYLEANPHYWRGEPAIALIRLMEMSTSDMAYAVVSDAADLASLSLSKEDLKQIRSVNSNGRESGNVVTTVFTDYEAFGYIGMNAQRVCVNEAPLSKESIYLRRAFATVFSFFRYASVDAYYGDTAGVIQYPLSRDSWVAVRDWEAEYEKAFIYGLDGKRIYTADMTYAQRKRAVKEAARAYLRAAGYTEEDGVFTAAPEGAGLSYEVHITGYGKKDHPAFAAVSDTAAVMRSLGLKLKIKDYEQNTEMFEVCEAGKADIWVAAWPVDTNIEEFFYSLYHSLGGKSYMYALHAAEVDAQIEAGMRVMSSKKKKEHYRKAIGAIMRYAVEVPTYQRRSCFLYSSKRLRADSLPADQTSSYNWFHEIEKLKVYGD